MHMYLTTRELHVYQENEPMYIHVYMYITSTCMHAYIHAHVLYNVNVWISPEEGVLGRESFLRGELGGVWSPAWSTGTGVSTQTTQQGHYTHHDI